MNLGIQILKVIKTNEPLMEEVFSPFKGVYSVPTGQMRELHITNIDRVTTKAPNMGHFLVYKDERVEVYQRKNGLKRVFVLCQPSKNSNESSTTESESTTSTKQSE